jgi:hypothetical protein
MGPIFSRDQQHCGICARYAPKQWLRVHMAASVRAKSFVQMQRSGIVPGQRWHDEVAAAVLGSMIREDRLTCTASNACCQQRGDNQA